MYLICPGHIQAYLLMNAMEFHVYYINVLNVIFIYYFTMYCIYVVPNYEMVIVGGFCFMGVKLLNYCIVVDSL